MSARTQLATKSNATLWLLLGVLGVVAVTYAYTGPSIAKLKEVRLTALARAADTQELQARISQIVALEQQLKLREDKLKELDVAVPADPSIDEFVRSLEAMASASGVLLTSIQPAQAESSVASVSVSLRGSYSGIHLFLQRLATSRRPVAVRSLALSTAADAGGTSLLSATMQLDAATGAQAAVKEGSRAE